MPTEMREPVLEAVKAYGDGLPIVIRDDERRVLLHGREELESLSCRKYLPHAFARTARIWGRI